MSHKISYSIPYCPFMLRCLFFSIRISFITWLLVVVFFKDYFCVKKMHLLSSAAVSILYYRSSSYNYIEILNSLSSPFDFAL